MEPSRRTKLNPCSLSERDDNAKNSVLGDEPTEEGGSPPSLPERRLQDGEEARELRHHQTLDGAVVGSQSEQVPHQCLHLRGHARTVRTKD